MFGTRRGEVPRRVPWQARVVFNTKREAKRMGGNQRGYWPILNKSSALVQCPRWRLWRPQGRIAPCAAKGSRVHVPGRLGKSTGVLLQTRRQVYTTEQRIRNLLKISSRLMCGTMGLLAARLFLVPHYQESTRSLLGQCWA